MAEEPGYRAERWSRHFDGIASEIAKYASICRVDMLEPGVIQRVINDDATVCGTQNEAAFKKMRNLLLMHYNDRQKAVQALGAGATQQIIDDIVARLRARVGK